MKRTKRVFGSAFKAEVALEAIKDIKTVSELAQVYELHPAQIMQRGSSSKCRVLLFLRAIRRRIRN